MKKTILNILKDVNLQFERIEKDSEHLKVNIYWKEDINLSAYDNFEVYVELGTDVKQSIQFKKLNNQHIWHAVAIIDNTASQVYYFDKKLVIKIVQFKAISHNCCNAEHHMLAIPST